MSERLLVALAVLVVLAVVATVLGIRRRSAELARVLERFGRPTDREHDLEHLGKLRALRAHAAPADYLDERTARDLDLDQVFAAIDHTTSVVGAQCLYDRLHHRRVGDDETARLDRHAAYLQDAAARREWYQRRLHGLSAWRDGYLASLLWGAAPVTPAWFALLPVLSLVPLASLLLAAWWPPAIVGIVVGVAVNLAVKAGTASRTNPWLPSLRALPSFFSVASSIARQEDEALRDLLAPMREDLSRLRLLRTSARWVGFESTGSSVAAGMMAEWIVVFREFVNLFFLLDVTAFSLVARQLGQAREDARRVLLAVGALDVAISLASFRASVAGRWSRPEWLADGARELQARDLVHPLVRSPVPVTVELSGRSWLVTGSNMAGKSTLLRSIGVGIVMAETLGTVLATSWRACRWGVQSCIGRADSVADGKSYYLAEVERVRDLLTRSEGAEPTVFLLDELFRGTNTQERVAAALAVLEHLDHAPHLVVVATHDVELLEPLSARYACWHFREEVRDGTLSFDYVLRPGAASSRNAIALLAAHGYPATVVDRARAVVMPAAARAADVSSSGSPGSSTGP